MNDKPPIKKAIKKLIKEEVVKLLHEGGDDFRTELNLNIRIPSFTFQARVSVKDYSYSNRDNETPPVIAEIHTFDNNLEKVLTPIVNKAIQDAINRTRKVPFTITSDKPKIGGWSTVFPKVFYYKKK